VNEVSDEVVGFGPVEFLLKDPGVTEVTVDYSPGAGIRRVVAAMSSRGQVVSRSHVA
jgi:Flp pilus assembly CpaF family ATPase